MIHKAGSPTKGDVMKQITMTLILLGAFSWSNAMAQTQEQGHQHEQHQRVKETPADKGLSMKDEMKQKMKEKMKDMKCCPKEEQNRTEKLKYPCFSCSAHNIIGFSDSRIPGISDE